MKRIFFGMIILVFSLTLSHSVLANSANKSPNKPSFENADTFYKNNVNKNDYEEFADAKLIVRELMMVQDLAKVFDNKEWMNYPSVWKTHQKKDIIGNTKDLASEQQVYYFFSLKDDGENIYIKNAMYDAKTKEIYSKGNWHWTKEEFKRKFEQK